MRLSSLLARNIVLYLFPIVKYNILGYTVLVLLYFIKGAFWSAEEADMGSAMEKYLLSLKDKRVAVLGIGISNRPLIELLRAAEIDVTACDKKEQDQFDKLIQTLEQTGVHLCLGQHYLEHLAGMDVIFRTPGMRPDLPPLQRAAEQGAVITSEMEVFFQVCPCKIVAVTGSDGKTTTTTIIAGLLEQAGYRTHVGGNIGRPLLPQVESIHPEDMVVVELSSFQLMTMEHSPDIAVVTNLSPNHLDVHLNMEEYVDAKRNIYLHQSTTGKLVLNRDNEITAAFAEDARGAVVMFGHAQGDVFVRDGIIWCGNRAVLPLADIQIPGRHNVENYMAAIAAVDGLVPDAVIRDYARNFSGVAHRIELVREVQGVSYYNDSIASSPSRTIAGLRSFSQKVILLAGGYDKHIPYDELGPEIVKSVKTLIVMGATGPKIQEAAKKAGMDCGGCSIVEVKTLQEAVWTAHQLAEPGDVVLLSPASASFDQFANFEQRGNAFKEYIQKL